MDIQENRKEHMLKTDPAVFQDVLDGSKTFEIRFNDRGYQIGDLIVLKETKFTGQQMKSGQPLVYTGREIQKRISYVLGGYGLQDDWVILGIQDIEATKAQAVPEGFVLVEKKNTEDWYLDDCEGMWWDHDGIDGSLCELDIGEVQAVEHKEYLITENNTLYATRVWDDANDQVDCWQFFKTKEEAEKAAAYCKAKFYEEAQEPTND